MAERWRRHLKASLVIVLAIVAGAVGWFFLVPPQAMPEPPTPGVVRQEFTVQFDGFQARGQITYPEGGAPPYPAVFLIAGSGPADMDVSLADADGKLQTRLLRDISDTLTRQGYATVRYNKRHVRSATEHPAEGDYPRLVTPRQLQADFDRVYALAAAQPQIDRSRIVVYGWSEGAMIATQAALDHPEIAGLVLHAPPAGSYKESHRFQLLMYSLAFFSTVVDADRDGAVTLAELDRVPRGDVSVSLRDLLSLLRESSWWRGPWVFRAIDTNRDGKIDLAIELRPVLVSQVTDWDAQLAADGLGAYGTQSVVPLRECLPRYPGPILLLHGEADGNVPADDSRQLAALAQRRDSLTLHIYPGLGHTLGDTRGPFGDIYAPIRPEPLHDLIVWLETNIR